MTDVKDLFGQAAVEAEAEVSATEAKEEGLSENEAKALVEGYKAKVKNDPSIQEKVATLSNSVMILKTLGTNRESSDDKSSIVLDKEATAAKTQQVIEAELANVMQELGCDKEAAIEEIKKRIKQVNKSTDKEFKKKYSARVVKKTTGICGYLMKNVGDVAITYPTQKCTKGADGVWTVERMSATANPGEEFQISRPDAIRLGTLPEFLFTFANGKLVRKNIENTALYLKSSYINIKAADGKKVTVHDADIKKVIDKVDKDGKVTVLKEFASVFGYLENEEVKAPKAPKEPKDKQQSQKLLQAAIADKLSAQLANI